MLKKIKKAMAAVVALVMSLGVLMAAPVAQAQEKVNLTFWHGMGGNAGDALQKLVDQFNESQDEIEVEAVYQGSYDETLTKLRSSAAGSEVGADLVQVFELGMTFMKDSGLVVPVQDYIDKNDFPVEDLEENLLAYYTVDDILYTMPFNSSTPLLYYNKDIFEKAGIEEAPKSIEEIIEVAPKLTEAGAAMPMSMRVYGWFMEQLMIRQQKPIYDAENGRGGAPSKVVFDGEDGGMTKLLSEWKRGLDEGVLPNVGREGGQPEFVSGQAAMTAASTASLRQILTEVDGRFEVGTAYFPGVSKDDQGGVSIGGASLWMIESGDDAKKDATWKFIEFLLSPASQAQWNADTGYFPVNTKAHDEQVFKDNIAEFPQFETAINQLHDATPADQGALSGVNQEARQIMENHLENVLNGVSSPEEATKAMAEEINAAITNYNEAN